MAAELDIDSVFKLKMDGLKHELSKRGLSKSGLKSELQERLLQFVTTHDGNVVSTSQMNTAEEIDNGLVNLDTPTDTEPPLIVGIGLSEKDILSESTDETEVAPKTATTKPIASVLDTPVIVNPSGIKKPKEVIAKVLSTTAAEDERKANRSKRFGGSVSVDARKKARIEKFGAVSSSNQALSDDEKERIKKRTERFGVVSPNVVKESQSDRLQKRLDRFADAKVKKRVDRFGVVQPTTLSSDMQARKNMRSTKFGIK